ncbi:MAG: DUF1192 domain-containing protein [Bdellovibrionales bacterium]|jgi:uncharacterized small protein (DUF1192 family)|nr:DUF1192 domain-containing protein [Bdellovibrionales bacterium]
MIFDEDSEPKNKKPVLRPLDKMSLAELDEYLAQLEAEKTRVSEEIARKKKHMQDMDALFGKKPAG